MKTLVALFVVLTASLTYAQQPTATTLVKQLRELSKQQVAEMGTLKIKLASTETALVSAQLNSQTLKQEVDLANTRAEELRSFAVAQQTAKLTAEAALADEKVISEKRLAEARQNARERDVFVWAFGLIGAALITVTVGPHLVKAIGFQPGAGILVYVGLYLVSLTGMYGLIRVVLRFVTNL